MYSVRLESGEVVSAHVGSDLRMRIVRLLLGDRVVVELGETDPSRGRIVSRLRAKEEQV
jgi:translation initiation factor IF-1